MFCIADLTRISLTCRWCELIAPFVGTVGLATKGNIGGRHFLHISGETVDRLFFIALEEINRASFS